MGNEEQVELLRLGVEAWNEWRRNQPDVRPDLSHADFARADLRGVDLKLTKLEKVELSGADLSDADFSGAHAWGVIDPAC